MAPATRAPMNLISSEPIFHVNAELADIRHFGRTPYGDRRVIDIIGGRVDGPKLKGRILPGADWQIVCPNGTADLTARYGIETNAGARVLGKSEGLPPGPPRAPGAPPGWRAGRGEPLLFPHRHAVRGGGPLR